MKNIIHVTGKMTIVLAMLVGATVGRAAPAGTAFTYQGRLLDGNQAANNLYDLRFRVFSDPNAGVQRGLDAFVEDVNVIDGYFAVELDFGSIFDANAVWLDVAVRAGDIADPNAYTALLPRQRIGPAPHAIYAATAGGMAGGVEWGGILNVPEGFADGVDDVGLTSEADPTVAESVKDGVDWSEVTGMPAGFSDGIDDVGLIAETDPTVAEGVKDGVDWTEVTGIPAGFADGTDDVGDSDWTISDSNMYSAVAGNVGIGTTSPRYKLSIDNGSMLLQDMAPAGTSGPYIKFKEGGYNDVGGIFFQASGSGNSNQLRFTVGAANEDPPAQTQAMVINQGGNVGVGTTSPAQKLDVVGNAAFSGNVGIGTTSPSGRLDVHAYRVTSGEAADQQQTNTGEEHNYDSFWQSFTAGITGNLTKVHLNTRARYTFIGLPVSANATLKIHQGQGTGGAVLATRSITVEDDWGWRAYTFSSPPFLESGNIYTVAVAIEDTIYSERTWMKVSNSDAYAGGRCNVSASRDLAFQTYVAGCTLEPALTLKRENGNVGIGTTSPKTQVDITRTLTVGANPIYESPSSGSGSNLEIRYRTDGSVDTAEIISIDRAVGRKQLALEGNPILLQYGNVGIGTTSPAQKLDVAGNAAFSGNVGIGTTSPEALLDVNGIALVQGKQVAVGDENLRVIRGTVLANGTKHAGSGFTVTKGTGGEATGFYYIYFDTAFSARPSVVTTWKYPDSGDDFGSSGTSSNVYTTCMIAVSTTRFKVKVQGTSGGAVDRGFEFIAAGLR